MGDEILDRIRAFAHRGGTETEPAVSAGPADESEAEAPVNGAEPVAEEGRTAEDAPVAEGTEHIPAAEDAAGAPAAETDAEPAGEGGGEPVEAEADAGSAGSAEEGSNVHEGDGTPVTVGESDMADEVLAPEAAGEEAAAHEMHAHSNGHAPGGLAAAADIRHSPIPAGSVIFGELTSAFVDGPRLLRFLGDRRHTGAVVDNGGGRTQVAVLHDGGVLAIVSTADTNARRLDAIALPTPGASESDEHQISVLTYRPEIAVAVAQLVNLPERFERMHGSFVDFPALLEFLKRESANGAVRVTTGDDTGVALLRYGNVLGAYTARRPELEDADILFDLARQPDAEIDVHVGSLEIPPHAASVHDVVR